MNRVCLSGRLVRDPEMKYTQSGTALCKFSIATDDRKKDGDKWVDDPTFIDMTAWGKRGETLAQYKRKGDTLIVEGRVKLETWDDKQSGQKRSRLVIAPDKIEWPGKNDSSNQRPAQTQATQAQAPAPQPEDDVPF